MKVLVVLLRLVSSIKVLAWRFDLFFSSMRGTIFHFVLLGSLAFSQGFLDRIVNGVL